jgi:hypothetical protein
MILMARTCRMLRQYFLMPSTHSASCEKERLERSDSDDGRTGSSPSDGFVLAIFPWLLKGAPRCEVAHPRRGAADRGERGKAAGAVGKPESESWPSRQR